MRRRKLIWFGIPISIVGIAIALTFCMTEQPVSSSKKSLLAVSFLSYSNSPSGQTYVILGMTNLDSCDLILCGMFATDFSDKPDALDETRWCSLPTSALHPGAYFQGVAQVPARKGKWRLRWNVQRWRLRDRAMLLLGNWTPWDTTAEIDSVVTDWMPDEF
jgi:hypothetical protein